MAMFPGRFPNEIMDSLDASLLWQVMEAREIERVESRLKEWLKIGTELTTDDWEAIREHDRLVEDHTVKVVTQ
jgi:hypothetical protein